MNHEEIITVLLNSSSLTRKEILEEMVDLIVMEPDEEVEDKLRYK